MGNASIKGVQLSQVSQVKTFTGILYDLSVTIFNTLPGCYYMFFDIFSVKYVPSCEFCNAILSVTIIYLNKIVVYFF